MAGGPSPLLYGGSDATCRLEHVSIGRCLQSGAGFPEFPRRRRRPRQQRSQTAMNATASLPFEGNISGTTRGIFTPPATLEISLSGHRKCHASRSIHVRSPRDVGTFPNPVATGTWVFTAANGDRLFATTESTGTPVGPGIDDVRTVATITGGTGRFTDAAGAFTALVRASHDASSGEGEFSGSFSGHLSLDR